MNILKTMNCCKAFAVVVLLKMTSNTPFLGDFLIFFTSVQHNMLWTLLSEKCYLFCIPFKLDDSILNCSDH